MDFWDEFGYPFEHNLYWGSSVQAAALKPFSRLSIEGYFASMDATTENQVSHT